MQDRYQGDGGSSFHNAPEVDELTRINQRIRVIGYSIDAPAKRFLM